MSDSKRSKSAKLIPGEKYGKLTFIKSLKKKEPEVTIPYPDFFLCDCGRGYWGEGRSLLVKLRKGKELSCGCAETLPKEKNFQVKRKGEKPLFFFSINTKGWKREQIEAMPIIFRWFINQSGLPVEFLHERRHDLRDLCIIFSKNYLAFLQLLQTKNK